MPLSITIGICRPLFTLFLFSCIFSSDFVGPRCHFSSWLDAHEYIPTRVFPHYLLVGVIVTYFLIPHLVMLLIDALPLHSVFWHLHYFAVSSPSCACFIMDLASECLLHHASKCISYSVQSLCIHWLHIVHPIILPVHDRTRNLGFCIFPKCGACTFPSYRVSSPHILVNISLSCFLRSIIFQNKVWHIFAGTLP